MDENNRNMYVSVIMPAYNASGTIKTAIESVLYQSYRDWELLVIDDCSSDDTIDIVEEIIENHKEHDIKLIKNPKNKGVAYSRNRGIEESRGEWISFLDSDDLWKREKLEKQVEFVCRHFIRDGIIFTGSSFITRDEKSLDFVLHVPAKIDRKELLKQNLISCSSVMVSRSLIQKNKFPDEIKTIHEDFVVWLEILGTIPFAYGIDEPLLTYRVAADSKSGKKLKAAIMNWNTYRYIGFGLLKSMFYMVHYSIRGLKKWTRIKINYQP